MLDVLAHLFEIGSAASVAEFAFMLWLVWQRRNKALDQDELANLDNIPGLAVRLSSEYLAAHEPMSAPLPDTLRQIWIPPVEFEFKANCDAALFPSHNMTSVRVVIRDGRGLPIAALCKRFPCLHVVDDAEALAIREAVQLTRDIGIKEVEVEGDSLVISHAVRNQEVCFASYGDIIKDAELLACSLNWVGFSHVRRDGNRAAHVLARKALELSSDFLIWLENVPTFLEVVIQSECSPTLI